MIIDYLSPNCYHCFSFIRSQNLPIFIKVRRSSLSNLQISKRFRSFSTVFLSLMGPNSKKGYRLLSTEVPETLSSSSSPSPTMRLTDQHQTRKHSINDLNSIIDTQYLTTDSNGNFIERESNRKILLRGINLDSSAKLPNYPKQATYTNPKSCGFWNLADDVSFVGRPFPLEEAYEHLTRIKLWGYNTIRYIITWEAIEHKAPGIYDDDFVNYTVQLLKIIDQIGGLYVFIDPHQDVWSRFSGGCGAPLWTLYAAGLEPRNFPATEAALIHNVSEDPQKFPKMVWASNYFRLASETMFTLFFSGKLLAPKCIINGVNIQDFLQDHFVKAIGHFLKGVKTQAPELFNKTLIGIESMNEPNCGMYGFRNLELYPASQELKLNTCPKPIQSLRLGMGIPQTVDIYGLSVFGPRKQGSKLIDPLGQKAWISNDHKDKHYGFNRDPNWKLGVCIFAQHDVWDPNTGELLNPDYFNVHPRTGEELNMETFINTDFVAFYSKFQKMIRSIDSELYSIMQHPVFEIPPNLKHSSLIDNRTAIAQHYYDGMSLMFKTWNRKYNVDTLGIMRGRYLNPAFGLVFGESNIRKSIRSQMKQLKQEANDAVGKKVPVLITETGMPFDMDDKTAYQTGDYSSQESANDAIGYALEGVSGLNSTYWCYNSRNSHKWGDNWNLEDFSLFSKDDTNKNKKKYLLHHTNYGDSSITLSDGSSTGNSDYLNWITNGNGSAGSSDSSSSSKVKDEDGNGGLRENTFEVEDMELEIKVMSLLNGTRVAKAIVRPYPVLVNGTVTSCEFDLSGSSFDLIIDTGDDDAEEGCKTLTKTPTVIYIPDLHFQTGQFSITVSHGMTIYRHNRLLQVIEWFHESPVGEIKLSVSKYSDGEGDEDVSEGVWSSLKLLACGYV